MKNDSDMIIAILNSGLAIETAIYNGDYKANNKEIKKIFKLFEKVYKADPDSFLNEVVPKLLKEGCYATKIQTCNFLFDIQTCEAEAEAILKDIVADEEARIFSHEAKMVLRYTRGIKL